MVEHLLAKEKVAGSIPVSRSLPGGMEHYPSGRCMRSPYCIDHSPLWILNGIQYGRLLARFWGGLWVEIASLHVPIILVRKQTWHLVPGIHKGRFIIPRMRGHYMKVTVATYAM